MQFLAASVQPIVLTQFDIKISLKIHYVHFEFVHDLYSIMLQNRPDNLRQ